ncbi:hypothetical protein BJV74DRAFT_586937 [Russula compacta]|nr:hypothetical protein BJV74DRAFT_586937 [Russula compacta]
MAKFNNPTTIQQDLLALKDFWHTINGLFIWEFVTTLDYELSIIRGRRPYRWTIWIYSITRLAALVAIILAFIGLDVTSRYNCQAWVTLGLFFGCLSIASASLLIVLRIIAIWNRTKVIVAIAAGVWVINVLVMIQGFVRVRSAWDPAQGECVAFSIESSKPNIIVTLITDIILLLTMLIGLLRLRIQSGDVFGIASLLWKQGLIWLLLATIAEVPTAVFIILNLNDPLDMMFQHFTVIVMSIAATRMYRSLADFVSGSTEQYDLLPFLSSPLALTAVDDSMTYPTGTKRAITELLDQSRTPPRRPHPTGLKCLWPWMQLTNCLQRRGRVIMAQRSALIGSQAKNDSASTMTWRAL